MLFDSELDYIVNHTWDGQSAEHVRDRIVAARKQLSDAGISTALCMQLGCGYAGLLANAYNATADKSDLGYAPYDLSFQAGLDANVNYLLRAHGNGYIWND